ncbi:MAG: TlpA family protein disulfide reductase [Anaerolineae bacterium]|nr:TlpA family protein disulfide reductase [Anaerolineae bacterium]
MQTKQALCRRAALLLVVALLMAACASPTPVPTPMLGPEVTVPTKPAASDIPKVGAIAPDFTLPDLNGDEVQLSDYRGKVLLLNFWATWCPPCQQEIPMFIEVYEELKGDDFVILAVSMGEGKDKVSSFVSQKGMSFPVLLDSSRDVARRYLVRAIPTSVMIDRDGVVQRIIVGMMHESQLRAELKDLL